MSFKIFICLAIISFLLFDCNAIKKRGSLKKSEKKSNRNSFSGDYSSVYLRNRATGYYIGRGDVYNTNGVEAVLDYNIDLYEINDGTITNLKNGLVLDVAETDIEKKQILLWPLHEDTTGNQKWIVKKHSTGFWSIKSAIDEVDLVLSSVDSNDATKGLTLTACDVTDPRQQWTLGTI